MAFGIYFLKAFSWFVNHIAGLFQYTWRETVAVAVCGFCYTYVHQAPVAQAWLVLTSVKYHGNLYSLIPLNQRLALTRLRATGPRLLNHY